MEDPPGTLMFLFGVGFLAANLLTARVCVQDWRRRHDAILAWRMPPPRYAALPALISVGLGILIVYKLVVLEWHVSRLFGEAMMLTYYGYLYPLSLRLKRGFYEQGVRLDRGFARWAGITGLSWRHEGPPVLIVAHAHQQAGRLTVPLEQLGAARRVLRDRIAAHQIHFTPGPLDLGGHDERQDV
ncbi:MAG: hypothetical protein R6V57_14160 [Vicinamibacterales bacterium]